MIYIHLVINIFSLITFNYLILYLVYFNTLLFLCDFLIIGVGESSSALGTLGGLPRDFCLFTLISVEIVFSTGASGILSVENTFSTGTSGIFSISDSLLVSLSSEIIFLLSFFLLCLVLILMFSRELILVVII